MMQRKLSNITGALGLLELMLTLAIVSVLLVLGTAYYQNAQTNNAVNTAMQNIQGLYAAFTKCEADNGNNSSNCTISQMVSQSYLPSMYLPSQADCSGANAQCSSQANPWGGNMSVVNTGSSPKLCPSDGSPYVQITVTEVPQRACQSLVGRINQTLIQQQQCISSDPTCPDSTNDVVVNY